MNVTQVLGGKAIQPTSGVAARARTSLNMYNEPPNEMLTLEDFEVLAFDRLKGKIYACINSHDALKQRLPM